MKFEALLNLSEVKASEMLTEFIEHELELLDKKNSVERKPTVKQMENMDVKRSILELMDDGERYTITEIMMACPECADLTNLRVSAIVRGMLGISVERIEEKRKAYFRKI
jgi:hypothetical protein